MCLRQRWLSNELIFPFRLFAWLQLDPTQYDIVSKANPITHSDVGPVASIYGTPVGTSFAFCCRIGRLLDKLMPLLLPPFMKSSADWVNLPVTKLSPIKQTHVSGSSTKIRSVFVGRWGAIFRHGELGNSKDIAWYLIAWTLLFLSNSLRVRQHPADLDEGETNSSWLHEIHGHIKWKTQWRKSLFIHIRYMNKIDNTHFAFIYPKYEGEFPK